MQPLGEQAVHHKVGRTQGLAHEGGPIYGVELCDSSVHILLPPCSEYQKSAHVCERFLWEELSLHLIIL